jgi:hypothetical protein
MVKKSAKKVQAKRKATQTKKAAVTKKAAKRKPAGKFVNELRSAARASAAKRLAK